MTPQQIIGVAARLFAIWLAITSVRTIGVATAMRAQPGAEPTALPYVIGTIFLIVALLLWLFPMVVAHKLVPRTQFDNILRVPAHEALVVASVVLGLWVIVARALPSLAYYVSLAAFWLKNGQPISTMDQSQHVDLVVGLIELAVAFFLVFRARPVVAYILPTLPIDKTK